MKILWKEKTGKKMGYQRISHLKTLIMKRKIQPTPRVGTVLIAKGA
jgi:hypothetical protein